MPAPHARFMEFDPFWSYQLTWGRGGHAKRKSLGNHPPYIELTHIAQTPVNHEEIIRWCNRYGLLGLLLFHTVQFVWPAVDALQVLDAPPGRVVDMELDELVMEALATPSHALVHVGGRIITCSVEEALGPYFPSMQNSGTASYSLLSGLGLYGRADTSVLRNYAEPVDKFVEAASQMRRAFDILAGMGDPPSGLHGGASKLLPPDYSQALRTTWEDLVWEDNAWRSRWQFSSLLAALYTMLRVDVGGGKIQRYCRRKKCGKPFITDNPQQEHCSNKCARAEEKARARERDRLAFDAVRSEWERVLAELDKRYPDKDVHEKKRIMASLDTKIIDRVVSRIERQNPAIDQQAVRRRAWRAWENLIRREGNK